MMRFLYRSQNILPSDKGLGAIVAADPIMCILLRLLANICRLICCHCPCSDTLVSDT